MPRLGRIPPYAGLLHVRTDSEAPARRDLSQVLNACDSGTESALRLDPTRYDMFLVKARAYEGLGDLPLAESLVRAYGELVGGLEGRPQAQALLDRIRGAQEASAKPQKKDRRLRRAAIKPEAVALATPEDLDPEPYRERVLAALSDGQCNAAASAATELTMAAPEVAEGWRLLGDAARCRDNLRGALLTYRRYTHLGGEEPKPRHPRPAQPVGLPRRPLWASMARSTGSLPSRGCWLHDVYSCSTTCTPSSSAARRWVRRRLMPSSGPGRQPGHSRTPSRV